MLKIDDKPMSSAIPSQKENMIEYSQHESDVFGI